MATDGDFTQLVKNSSVGLTLLCAAITYFTWQSSDLQTTAAFKGFQRQWLFVYLLAMLADWLQGPYVYILYSSYGFSQDDIAHLFIAGFGSSMLVGTVVGALADSLGRRRMSVAYSVFYGLSCVTKLYNNYWALMLGRILSGVATSLLFSAFETWMVSEHNARGFSESWLSQTFGYAIMGNSMVAIGSGFLASVVADEFGYVAPFMVALGVLIVCGLVVLSTWGENFGDSKVEVFTGMGNALRAIRDDKRIACVGMMQSLFEASMYTFVFCWTPALESSTNEEALPFGFIFACFMIAVMCGSSCFSMAVSKVRVEVLMQMNLLLATVALILPYMFMDNSKVVFAAFLLFEFCVGIYFPSVGTLRGKYISDDTRASMMNLFRVPLNVLVLAVLIKVSAFEISTVFCIISGWMAVALLLATSLVAQTTPSKVAVEKAVRESLESPVPATTVGAGASEQK